MSRSHKTARGTELPLLNLRGKEYLEVKYRLVWFREEHPDWTIETEYVSITDKSALAKATVRDGQGRVLSVSHKFENERGFPDFIEKAETGAIGRALALVGYGTQFCADELDEGNRIVDSPVQPTSREQREMALPQGAPAGLTKQAPAASSTLGAQAAPAAQKPSREQLGDFQILFGKKYRGKKLKELPEKEVLGYVDWLHSEAQKKGVPVSHEVKLLTYAVENYWNDDRGDEASNEDDSKVESA